METAFLCDDALHCVHWSGALSIQPKIPENLVGTSNGMDHFSLVRPEYARPALKVVHFDRSCYLGQSDRNVPFHLTKLLSPVPLFCILLTRTITKCTVAWVGSVQPECTVLCGISEMSNRNFGWMESASGLPPSPNLWNNLQPRQNKAANTVKFRK